MCSNHCVWWKVKINVPAEERETYIIKHHSIFSLDKNVIGLATNLKHRIDLKNKKQPTENISQIWMLIEENSKNKSMNG
jgi:hypothetical protein